MNVNYEVKCAFLFQSLVANDSKQKRPKFKEIFRCSHCSILAMNSHIHSHTQITVANVSVNLLIFIYLFITKITKLSTSPQEILNAMRRLIIQNLIFVKSCDQIFSSFWSHDFMFLLFGFFKYRTNECLRPKLPPGKRLKQSYTIPDCRHNII